MQINVQMRMFGKIMSCVRMVRAEGGQDLAQTMVEYVVVLLLLKCLLTLHQQSLDVMNLLQVVFANKGKVPNTSLV